MVLSVKDMAALLGCSEQAVYNPTTLLIYGSLGRVCSSRALRCERYARWLLCWIHATNRSASGTVEVLTGKRTASNPRSCDTVSAGAFFPQTYRHMPPKAVCEHAGSYVMMPAAGRTDCLLLPPPFARSFRTALCNSPAPATEPNHQRPSATHRRIAAVVPRDRM